MDGPVGQGKGGLMSKTHLASMLGVAAPPGSSSSPEMDFLNGDSHNNNNDNASALTTTTASTRRAKPSKEEIHAEHDKVQHMQRQVSMHAHVFATSHSRYVCMHTYFPPHTTTQQLDKQAAEQKAQMAKLPLPKTQMPQVNHNANLNKGVVGGLRANAAVRGAKGPKGRLAGKQSQYCKVSVGVGVGGCGCGCG